MVARVGSSARLRRASRSGAPQGFAAPEPRPEEAASPAPAPVFSPRPMAFAQPATLQAAPAALPLSPAVNAPSGGVEEGSVGIAELGDILIRRSKLILATTALATLLGTAAAFLISPRYTASSALFIDPRGRAAFQTENLPPGGAYDPNLVDSLTFVMESETVLRRVVAAEGLAKDPEFAGTTGDPNINAVANLKDAVKVKRPDRTYVVEVQVRTKDAAKSARIANAMAKAYISDGSDNKNDTVSREQGWVDKQLGALEKRLREAEARVDEYKTRNGLHGAEGRLVGEQQLADMNRVLSDSQRKAAEAKSTLDQVDALRRAGRLPDATNEALRSGVIERLRTQQAEILRLEANSRSTLGPRHPASIEVREQLTEVQRQINEELGRIAENARSAFALARANVQGIERELERLKKTQSSDSHTTLGLRELERAVDAQKTVYEKFLRDKEAISRLSIETPAGRIIQSAEVPTRATFPNKPLFIALGATAGLLLGVGLALLLETLTRGRARLAGGAGGQAGFAPLAPTAPGRSFGSRALPSLDPLPAAAPRPLLGLGRSTDPLSAVISAPEGAYAKAVDALAGRFWPRPDIGPRSVLVSALAPKAGAAANPALVMALALALARRGQSVLLVDGHGGAGSLSAGLGARGTPSEVILSGRRQSVLLLGEGLPGALYLLPMSALAATRTAGRGPARVDITVIDGPALKDPAFAALDIGRSIEGVVAVLPKGERKVPRALQSDIEGRIGDALIGLVTGEG